jgi:hypothetical protein
MVAIFFFKKKILSAKLLFDLKKRNTNIIKKAIEYSKYSLADMLLKCLLG